MLRRQIGRKFEMLRRAAGLTMEQAAEQLDRARATLHRIENGAEHVRYRQADVQQMLDLYGASAEDSELLLAITARPPGRTRTGGTTTSAPACPAGSSSTSD